MCVCTEMNTGDKSHQGLENSRKVSLFKVLKIRQEILILHWEKPRDLIESDQNGSLGQWSNELPLTFPSLHFS